jgi:hypothetical protein
MTNDAYYPPSPAHLSLRLDNDVNVNMSNGSTLSQLLLSCLDIPVADHCHACGQNQNNKICFGKLCSRCCRKCPEKCSVHSHNEGKPGSGVSVFTKEKGQKAVHRSPPVFDNPTHIEYVKQLDAVINGNMTTNKKKSLYIAYTTENPNPTRDLTKVRKIVPLHWNIKSES